MLTEEQTKEILAEAAHFPHKQAASIEALRIVQRDHGWVSDEALEEIARLLEMTTAELDGVATFFNLIYRQPVGRHVILICNSVTCWLMGYPGLRDHLVSSLGIEFGGTTQDGRFTLLPVVCLGDCDHAPAMMVGEDLHHDLTPEKIDQILAQYT